MKCFWDDRQRLHAPAGEFFNGAMHPAAEHPGRVDAILQAIGPTAAPDDAGLEPMSFVWSYSRFRNESLMVKISKRR